MKTFLKMVFMISIPLEMAICSKSTVPMVSKVVFLVFFTKASRERNGHNRI